MQYYTNHALARMNQRGITKEMIELTLEYGRLAKDKIVFNKKHILQLLDRVTKTLKSKLLKLLDKGGLVVVLGDNTEIVTVYNPYR